MTKIRKPLEAIGIAALIVGCEAPEMPVSKQTAAPAAAEDESTNGMPAQAAPPKEFDADSPQKGRKSKAAGGYLGAVGHARFWAEHEAFRIQIQHSMNAFRAINDRYPESQEEFMEEIIKPLQKPLPELPEGEEYIYDPETGKLMVQQKAN